MKTAFTRKIFMVRPANFGCNPETAETNSFQSTISNNTSLEIAQIARSEFDVAVAKMRCHGIEVVVYQDSKKPIKPDAVFPNNWISTHPSGHVFIYPMLTPNRQLEVRLDIVENLGGNSVHDFRKASDLILEGTGSVVIDHEAKLIYFCDSDRTDARLVTALAEKLNFSVCGFKSVDHKGIPIYHTNVVMFVMNKFVVIGLETIGDEIERKRVVEAIVNSGKKVLELSYDQITQFAGNMVQLRTASNSLMLVCSETAWAALEANQKKEIKKVSEVLSISIPTIELYGGGSARCMIAENYI